MTARTFKVTTVMVDDHKIEVFTSDRFEEPATVYVDGQRVEQME